MKGYDIGTNAAVIKMATMQISGNVIPLSWFKHIKLPNGKPDSVGVLLLSDIVYWYRPIELRDEATGALIGYRKKFAADKLQRSYDGFADVYGYTKDQVKDALKRLEGNKLIDLDFRHPVINGVKYGNLLFIGLNADRLAEITTPLSSLKVGGSSPEIPHPPTFKDDTNTETTPETTTETSQEEEGMNPLFSFYQNKIGMITPIMADAIEKAEKVYTAKWVADAIELASEKGARHWNYCEAVLKRWKQEGRADKRPGKKQSVAQSGDHSKYTSGAYAEYLA
jgi:DnaD/phage-associated family protein